MGVMTSSQFVAVDKNIGVAEGNKPSHRHKYNNAEIVAFKFPPAPKGKSRAFVTCNEVKEGKLIIPLTDGIFNMPKSWNNTKKKLYKKVLLADKWEDASYIVGKPKKEEKPKKYMYFAGHPENTDTEKVDGNIAIAIEDEEIKLECIKGVIKTERKDIYQALLEKGFYEVKPPKAIK